jgi:hypothetical protein
LTTPQERWSTLSDAFAAFMDKSNEGRFRAGRLATIIGRSLRTYLGMSEEDGRLRFYHYSPAENARYDEFTKADNGFDAVSQMEDGRWGFAFGLELERAPGALPRLRVRWLMFIDLKETIEVEIGLCKGTLPLRHTGSSDPICARIFEGLRDNLLKGAQGSDTSSRIGFI